MYTLLLLLSVLDCNKECVDDIGRLINVFVLSQVMLILRHLCYSCDQGLIRLETDNATKYYLFVRIRITSFCSDNCFASSHFIKHIETFSSKRKYSMPI